MGVTPPLSPESDANHSQPSPRHLPMVAYALAGVMAVYLTMSLLLWLWLLGDGAAGSFRVLAWLHIPLPTSTDAISLLKVAYFAAVGGGIGGVTFGMMNLQRHVTAGTFRSVFVGDYIFRPFGAAALALVVFSLARGGILTILGADPASGSASNASKLSSLGVGFLVGFASVQVVQFLTELATRVFSSKKQTNDRTGLP